MRAPAVVALIVILIGVRDYCVTCNTFEAFEQHFVTAIRSLKGAAASLEFLDLVKTRLNVDALIGVRIFADQSNCLVTQLSNEPHRAGSALVNTLVDLNQQAEDLLRDAALSVAKDDATYWDGEMLIDVPKRGSTTIAIFHIS